MVTMACRSWYMVSGTSITLKYRREMYLLYLLSHVSSDRSLPTWRARWTTEGFTEFFIVRSTTLSMNWALFGGLKEDYRKFLNRKPSPVVDLLTFDMKFTVQTFFGI